MTPKEKAKELIKKFEPHADWNNDYGSAEKQANYRHAKCCALICVGVILNDVGAKDWINDEATNSNYWNEVKTELNKL